VLDRALEVQRRLRRGANRFVGIVRFTHAYS
jgi:hypothetical protein